jgi:hypothetical protein
VAFVSRRSYRKQSSKSSQGVAIARLTSATVLELVPLLGRVSARAISAGLALDDVVRLLKISFVHAALPCARLKNGRPSNARLAAATGMTRPEVTMVMRLIANTALRSLEKIRSNGRPLRVVRNWHHRISRTRSRDRWGIAFSGPNSFSEIVKESAGDIPPRAMLQELSRLGWVTNDPTRRRVTLLLKPDGRLRSK